MNANKEIDFREREKEGNFFLEKKIKKTTKREKNERMRDRAKEREREIQNQAIFFPEPLQVRNRS